VALKTIGSREINALNLRHEFAAIPAPSLDSLSAPPPPPPPVQTVPTAVPTTPTARPTMPTARPTARPTRPTKSPIVIIARPTTYGILPP
jgi:WAS/WASL-interacting protein